MLGNADRPDRSRPDPIPNYDLIKPIGKGTFGEVWLANERVTSVFRAIKIIYKRNTRLSQRELDGVKKYQQCAHNNAHLLQILTVGETDNTYYYVMPLADNAGASKDNYIATTLHTLMQNGQSIRRGNPVTALQITSKLLSAVIRLHSQEIAHCDIKPENILIVDGEPRLADIGLVASLTGNTSQAGSPSYMTPEGRPDDCYAIGKILYELITNLSADEFPVLPPEILNTDEHKIPLAIRVFNRACHPDPASRYTNAEDFAADIQSALKRPGRRIRIKRWWERRSPFQRAILTAIVSAICISSASVLYSVHGRYVPHRQYATGISFSAMELNPRPSASAQTTEQNGQKYEPYLSLGEVELDGYTLYTMPLPGASRYFIVDLHFLTLRPWGSAEMFVSAEPNGNNGVRMTLKGQPCGLGLLTTLSRIDSAGKDEEGKNVSGDLSGKIYGHPLPGIEYVLRLARFRKNDGGEEYQVALWPAGSAPDGPTITKLAIESPIPPSRFICFRGATVDSHARLRLLGMHVSSYSCSPEYITDDLPEFLEHQSQAAYIPATDPARPVPAGNLLASPCHPYESDDWMSIGHWAWWEGAAPGDSEDRTKSKAILSNPFSSELCNNSPNKELFDGYQFLRFDRYSYCDFEAKLRIELERNPDKRAPFPRQSTECQVGLAFRMQDTGPFDSVYGATYIAALSFHESSASRPQVFLQKNAQYKPDSTNGPFPIKSDASSIVHLAERTYPPIGFDAFKEEGFLLTIKAMGPRLQVLIDDNMVINAMDSEDDFLRTGRIGLFVHSTIAHFQSLEVTPL